MLTCIKMLTFGKIFFCLYLRNSEYFKNYFPTFLVFLLYLYLLSKHFIIQQIFHGANIYRITRNNSSGFQQEKTRIVLNISTF